MFLWCNMVFGDLLWFGGVRFFVGFIVKCYVLSVGFYVFDIVVCFAVSGIIWL